jgi:ACS family hexuronate transporter-like MFS transporter
MPDVVERVGRYRWTICALLFLATTINYMDRQVLSLLAPSLQRELHWSESDYGAIVSWFTFAYALGFLGAGRLMDRIGSRRGFAWAIVAWSVAAMGHALARGVASFSAARFALGVGESGNFPAVLKTIAEWFPQRERSLAMGIVNSGTNVGAILAPLVVPWIALTWGWRWAFVVVGALGFAWLAAWLAIYRQPGEHPRLRAAELAYIRDGAAQEPLAATPVRQLVAHRQLWAFALGKFMTDPVWWFYLFWLPKFLDEKFGVRLAAIAAPLVAIYVFADAGSIAGGWASSALIKRGWSVNAGRKITMLVAAVAIVPTMFAPQASRLWLAVAIVAVAAAAHQWWSCNIFTLPSDMFPRQAVGTVVGIGGFAGALGAVLFQRLTGMILQSNGNDYRPLFVICGLAYVSALLVIHLLAPRLTPVRLVAEEVS